MMLLLKDSIKLANIIILAQVNVSKIKIKRIIKDIFCINTQV